MGLDVFNGTGRIDWGQVKHNGEGFVCLKATEGLREVDPRLTENIRGAKAAGLMVSCYHYFRVALDPKRQAAHFWNAVRGAGYDPEAGWCYPLCGDHEDRVGIRASKISHSTLVNRTADFNAALQKFLGRPPVMYMDPDYAATELRGGFSGHPLWLACLGDKLPDPLPGGWKTWTFWQYSWTGKLAGIRGNVVDMDRFNGDLGALRAWAHPATAQPEPKEDE